MTFRKMFQSLYSRCFYMPRRTLMSKYIDRWCYLITVSFRSKIRGLLRITVKMKCLSFGQYYKLERSHWIVLDQTNFRIHSTAKIFRLYFSNCVVTSFGKLKKSNEKSNTLGYLSFFGNLVGCPVFRVCLEFVYSR